MGFLNKWSWRLVNACLSKAVGRKHVGWAAGEAATQDQRFWSGSEETSGLTASTNPWRAGGLEDWGAGGLGNWRTEGMKGWRGLEGGEPLP